MEDFLTIDVCRLWLSMIIFVLPNRLHSTSLPCHRPRNRIQCAYQFRLLAGKGLWFTLRYC